MPESYQVMRVSPKRIIPAKGDWPEKHAYPLLLDPLNGGQPIEAEEWRFHKAGPPKEGEHAEGTVSTTNFGLRFTRAKPDSAPSAGASTGDGYRSMPPEREASIIRQHSQDMALRDAQIRTMLDKEGFKKVFSCVWVKKVTDWYVAEAKGENPEAHYFDFDKVGEGQ